MLYDFEGVKKNLPLKNCQLKKTKVEKKFMPSAKKN